MFRFSPSVHPTFYNSIVEQRVMFSLGFRLWVNSESFWLMFRYFPPSVPPTFFCVLSHQGILRPITYASLVVSALTCVFCHLFIGYDLLGLGTHICMYICVYLYLYLCIYIYFVCKYICIYTDIQIYTFIGYDLLGLGTHISMNIYMYLYLYFCIYMCVQIHLSIYIYTYI